MHNGKKHLLTIIQISIILAAFIGISGPVLGDGTSQPLVIGASNDFPSNMEIMTSVFDSFLGISDEGRPIPGPLVSSWEVSDDKKQYTFHLTDGVTFQDGTAWNEKAAKWFFDWCREGERKDNVMYKRIADVTTPGTNIVQITLSEPYGAFLKDLSQSKGEVISPESVSPAWSEDGAMTEYIGTGPFSVRDYVKGQSAVLVRDDPTASGKITEIDWYVIPDANARVSALRAGDVNMIGAAEHHASVPYEQLPMLAADPKFTIERKSYGRYQVIEMNCRNGLLTDEKIREAINKAVDRTALVDQLLAGEATPAVSIIPSSYGFGSSIAGTEYVYDPDAARAILKEDGWTDSNGDGILDKNGEKLELNYVVPKGEANAELVSVFIQSELKKIGIDVIINTLESGAASKAKTDSEYDLYLHHSFGVPGLPEGPLTGKYHSTMSTWPASYHDDTLDSLIETAIESDANADYSAAYRYLQEKNVCIPLYDIEKIVVMDSGVKGLQLGPSIYAVDFSTVSVD